MSYSINVPAGPKHDLVDRLIAASPVFDPHHTELQDHLSAVHAAVPAIAAQVGRPEDHVEVSVSGHVTPMHAPSGRYADETCMVCASVVRAS